MTKARKSTKGAADAPQQQSKDELIGHLIRCHIKRDGKKTETRTGLVEKFFINEEKEEVCRIIFDDGLPGELDLFNIEDTILKSWEKVSEQPLGEEERNNYTNKLVKPGGGDEVAKRPPEELLNERVKVWWAFDCAFYSGTIEEYDAKKDKPYRIRYDDDEIEQRDLKAEIFELLPGKDDKKKKRPAPKKEKESKTPKEKEPKEAAKETKEPKKEDGEEGASEPVAKKSRKSTGAAKPKSKAQPAKQQSAPAADAASDAVKLARTPFYRIWQTGGKTPAKPLKYHIYIKVAKGTLPNDVNVLCTRHHLEVTCPVYNPPQEGEGQPAADAAAQTAGEQGNSEAAAEGQQQAEPVANGAAEEKKDDGPTPMDTDKENAGEGDTEAKDINISSGDKTVNDDGKAMDDTGHGEDGKPSEAEKTEVAVAPTAGGNSSKAAEHATEDGGKPVETKTYVFVLPQGGDLNCYNTQAQLNAEEENPLYSVLYITAPTEDKSQDE